MLLQSHDGTVHLLPALPQAWAQGSVKGLRARGGFITDFAWKQGQVVSYRIQATRQATLRLRVGDTVREYAVAPGDVVTE